MPRSLVTTTLGFEGGVEAETEAKFTNLGKIVLFLNCKEEGKYHRSRWAENVEGEILAIAHQLEGKVLSAIGITFFYYYYLCVCKTIRKSLKSVCDFVTLRLRLKLSIVIFFTIIAPKHTFFFLTYNTRIFIKL